MNTMAARVSHAHSCHIEILTPKQDSADLDGDLARFADKYRQVVDGGHVACITDSPMGILSFQGTEVIPELGLEVKSGQFVLHLNTFHTREAMDGILGAAADTGIETILVISGDGSERTPRLAPESIGMKCNAVTSVELLRFIEREHPGRFELGVAFNPYEPGEHELAKMRRKADAGAKFIITQPIIGRNDRLDALEEFGLPVIMDAWMSRKLHLLSECVGHEISEDAPYDPIENLRELKKNYPGHGLYLTMLGFKTQLPLLPSVLGNHG